MADEPIRDLERKAELGDLDALELLLVESIRRDDRRLSERVDDIAQDLGTKLIDERRFREEGEWGYDKSPPFTQEARRIIEIGNRSWEHRNKTERRRGERYPLKIAGKNKPMRRNSDEELRELERAWQGNKADTSASRAFFRALLRRGQLPEPDATPPRTTGLVNTLSEDRVFAYLDAIDRPEVQRLAQEIEELSHYNLISELEDMLSESLSVAHPHDGFSNRAAMITRQYRSIVANLRKRLADGSFDRELAVKAFGYTVEHIAKDIAAQAPGGYTGARGVVPWYNEFPASFRRAVADFLTRRFEARWATGYYKDWPKNKQGALRRYELERPKKQPRTASQRPCAACRSGFPIDMDACPSCGRTRPTRSNPDEDLRSEYRNLDRDDQVAVEQLFVKARRSGDEEMAKELLDWTYRNWVHGVPTDKRTAKWVDAWRRMRDYVHGVRRPKDYYDPS